MKISSTGQKIWAKLIGGLSGLSFGLTITESGDSAIYIGGWTDAFGITHDSDAILIKLSSNGDLEWIRLIGGAGENGIFSLLSQEDGSVVCSGDTSGYGEGNYDILLLKLTFEGALEWTKTFGTPSDDYSTGIQSLPSGE